MGESGRVGERGESESGGSESEWGEWVWGREGRWVWGRVSVGESEWGERGREVRVGE